MTLKRGEPVSLQPAGNTATYLKSAWFSCHQYIDLVAARLFTNTVSSPNTTSQVLWEEVWPGLSMQSSRNSGRHITCAGTLRVAHSGAQAAIEGIWELRVGLMGLAFWEPMTQKLMNRPFMANLYKKRPRYCLKTFDLRGLAICRAPWAVGPECIVTIIKAPAANPRPFCPLLSVDTRLMCLFERFL